MTAQLTVSTPSSGPHAGGLAGLVTLPESLRLVPTASDLVGVRGSAGWPAAAADALRQGARGVLIVQPVGAAVSEIEDLEALAESRSAAVVLDRVWADNPAVERSAPHFRSLAEARSLVEARVDLPLRSDLDQAALDLLALVRRAIGPIAQLDYVRRDVHGFDARGTLEGGVEGAFGVILSNSLRPEARVRLVRPTDAVELTVPAPNTAAPGRVVVSGPDGETLLETKYENSHRAAWRRLRDLVVEGRKSSDLTDFAGDLRVAVAARSVV